MLEITNLSPRDDLAIDIFIIPGEEEDGIQIDFILFGKPMRFKGEAAVKLADAFQSASEDYEAMAEVLDRQQGNDV